ncbi:MAG TPA: hypothetical protein VN808_18105 [Stellaceae bacterium]|nr:hypothetical protein [Stellaceae bacterium]
MKRVLLTAAAVAVATALGVVGASAAQYDKPMPGVAVYGPVQGTQPAGEVPPGVASPGYRYQWVYSYDHHGYRGHWEAQRVGS